MEIKNAFITGAATGIGRATAERLYSLGWSLGLVDIDLDALKEHTEHWDKDRVFVPKPTLPNPKKLPKQSINFVTNTTITCVYC